MSKSKVIMAETVVGARVIYRGSQGTIRFDPCVVISLVLIPCSDT